jgi:hypothetical protein
MIQLGLAFSDEKGTLPVIEGNPSVWQFNFREFDLEKDIYDPQSIKLLKESGIDLYKHLTHGVDAGQFAELLMSSGVVLNDSVVWVTFHGGYGFSLDKICLGILHLLNKFNYYKPSELDFIIPTLLLVLGLYLQETRSIIHLIKKVLTVFKKMIVSFLENFKQTRIFK